MRALAGHIFRGPPALHIRRVPEGISTHVYQIQHGGTFYLRILPEVGNSFAPEALVHTLLRERGVRVPEVVYMEQCNPDLGLSVMVTTEIDGRAIGSSPASDVMPDVLVQAGRDLAIINSVPVEGFGWIRRDLAAPEHLQADHATLRGWVFAHLEEDLWLLEQDTLPQQQVQAIHTVVRRYDHYLTGKCGRLAHGDFDVTHIFQQHGRYTGIIDFGEIRGTDPMYDLGHFHMRDGETLTFNTLRWLLEGHRQVMTLPHDYQERITFWSALIAVRSLARCRIKRPEAVAAHRGLTSIPRDIEALTG